MTITEDERHRYGQHYTPDSVARLLAAFAVRRPGDFVLDPSCGDGRLLEAAGSAKRALASAPKSPRPGGKGRAEMRPAGNLSRVTNELFGIDRSGKAVIEARRTGARVALADFFHVQPGCMFARNFTLPSRFDSIIGNPPYIRQELLAEHKPTIGRLFELTRVSRSDTEQTVGPAQSGRGEQICGEVTEPILVPRWSGRSDIYVYFFGHASAFLKEGGRLVFLTSSSWLDVGYGIQLQEFMLRNFRIIAVIESAIESFFEDASVNTSITVLEREADAERRRKNAVRFVQVLRRLDEIIPGRATETIKFARALESGAELNGVRIRTIEQAKLQESHGATGWAGSARPKRQARNGLNERGGRRSWGRFLRAEDVFFRVLEKATERLSRLADLASVRFGFKTGANDFFYVKPALNRGDAACAEASAMQPLEYLASVRRGMTTGANGFFYLKAPFQAERSGMDGGVLTVRNGAGDTVHIESEYLDPIVFSLKEIPAIEIRNSKTRMLFFNCPESKDELKGTRAIEYIRAGERAGIHLRPTCSARVPWYGVARRKEPAPLIFPSKVGERWLVAINRAGVYEDKKLYGIFPNPKVSIGLLAALLNSTWARYYAEMTCRQLTGAQAIADIDVTVAEQILVPDPQILGVRQRQQLRAAMTAIARRPVVSIFEEVRREDRRLLDELVLEAIGFDDTTERSEVLADLYRAATELVMSRLARSRKIVRVENATTRP